MTDFEGQACVRDERTMRKWTTPLAAFLGDLPLQSTIGAALIVGLALPALMVAWHVASEREQTLLSGLARDHAGIVETLARGMQTPIWDVRPDTGQPLIDVVMSDARVTAVRVTAPVFAAPLETRKPQSGSDGTIALSREVVRNGEPIGQVWVEMSPEPLKAAIAHQGWHAFLTALFQLALGLLLIYPLIRFKVLAPLQRLVDQSRALASGDLETERSWRRGDELGALGRSFEDTRRALRKLFQDLKERNATLHTREQALRESEELYRLLVDLSPHGILLHDHAGIQFMNLAGCGMLGAESPAAVLGHNYMDFVPESDRAECEQRLARVLEGETLEQTERRVRTLDGRDLTVAVSGVPFTRGEKRLGLFIFIDITEMKHAAMEIARQREALYQADKISALGSLLACVAHELNNPLSVVLGRAQLLSEADLDPRSADAVARIEAAADRCARIVRTFLAMARQRAPSRSPVQIEELIDSSLDLLGYGLKSAGIRVVREEAAILPITLADSDQLLQVFNNLISNSTQAMIGWNQPRELKILTRHDQQRNEIKIVFEDSGPGIPTELRDRIFDPFFTTKPEGAGTGIGLAVCRSHVEAHGGRIELLKAERGASFEITLPVVHESGLAETERSDECASPTSARVLIVDDEAEVRSMIGEILTADGHTVEEAEDGRQAVGLLANRRFDVVISDLLMPSLDGPALFDRLSSEDGSVSARMIFITGDTLSPPIREFLKRAKRPVIEKPFSPLEVRRAVARVVQGSRDPLAACLQPRSP